MSVEVARSSSSTVQLTGSATAATAALAGTGGPVAARVPAECSAVSPDLEAAFVCCVLVCACIILSAVIQPAADDLFHTASYCTASATMVSTQQLLG